MTPSGLRARLSAVGPSSPINSVLAAATGTGESGLGFVLLGLLLAAAGVTGGALFRQRALRRRTPES